MNPSLGQHNWFLIRDRKKVGPLPWQQLCTLAADGQLRPGDMVLCEGQTRWVEAASIPGLFNAPTAAVVAESSPVSAPLATLAPLPLPSATMLSDFSAADTHKSGFIPPIQLPGYQLLEELGRGGMGVVYKARQQKANRLVALKMILSGAHAGKEDLIRFQTEAEAVARLQHPHIVQVYEIGEHEGRPFFSLEYCGGGTLDRKLRDNPLVPKDAARLVEVLARAMHHAHSHHILHRDLKPANVLLTGEGVPKITDFGLAKKLDETGQTASGAVMGTPSYMSPEQASGKGKHLTPSTDVYALGALLYDCLAGRPPFRAATALDTILQVITDAPVPPAHLNPKVPADLQTICLKCLEKNPAHRYATAEELAEDLRRFTSGEPIQARPAGWVERSWKWAKRRPAAASLVVVTAVALLAILIGGFSFSVRLGSERNAAVREAQRADQERERAEKNEKTADELRTAAEQREVYVREQLDRARRSLLTAQIGRVAGLWQREPLLALQMIQDRNACPEELRDFSWGYYHALCLHWRPIYLVSQGASVEGIAVSPNAELAATVHGDSLVKLWDLTTRKERLPPLKGHQGYAKSVVFHPDGHLLATGGADKTIKLWNVADGKLLDTLTGHTGVVEGLDFSPDGKWLVSGSGIVHDKWPDHNLRHRDGEIRLWDVEKRKEEKVLLPKQDTAIRCVVFSSDGQFVAAATTHACKVWLFNVKTGERVREFFGGWGWVYRLAISPDGQNIAWSAATQEVYVANFKSGHLAHRLRGHQGDIMGLAWTPDSKTLATGDRDGRIKMWNPANGQERFAVTVDGARVDALSFSPDSKYLISGHANGKLTLWQMTPRAEWAALPEFATHCVAVSGPGPDSTDRATLAATTGNEVLLRNLADGQQRRLQLKEKDGAGTSLAFSPDAKLLAVGVRAKEGECQLWDTTTNRQVGILKTDKNPVVTAVQFSLDGKFLVVGQADGQVKLWDVAERTEVATLGKLNAAVHVLALSADGKLLAGAGGTDIRLWNLAERREVAAPTGVSNPVTGLGFVSGDQTLAWSERGPLVKLWDVKTGQLKTTWPQGDRVLNLRASPDGQSLAMTYYRDRNVKLLDVVSGQQRAVLGGFTREVVTAAFSPDGRYLAGASAVIEAPGYVPGGELKVWKADSGKR